VEVIKNTQCSHFRGFLTRLNYYPIQIGVITCTPLFTTQFHSIGIWAKFYKKQSESKQKNNIIEYECEELLHKVDPHVFNLELGVALNNPNVNGKLKCSVMGRNIPSPIIFEIPLIIKISHESAMQAAHEHCELSDSNLGSLLKLKID